MKLKLGDSIYRVSLPAPTWDHLIAQLSATATNFDSSAPFNIKYKDEDGDMVTVTNTPNIEEAMRSQKVELGSDSTLTLVVFRSSVQEQKRTPPRDWQINSGRSWSEGNQWRPDRETPTESPREHNMRPKTPPRVQPTKDSSSVKVENNEVKSGAQAPHAVQVPFSLGTDELLTEQYIGHVKHFVEKNMANPDLTLLQLVLDNIQRNPTDDSMRHPSRATTKVLLDLDGCLELLTNCGWTYDDTHLHCPSGIDSEKMSFLLRSIQDMSVNNS